MQSIHSYVRERESFYETQDVPLFDGVDFSMYDTLNKINHYWYNKYLETAYDDVIGDFPFDNISKFRVLLEARATDFDIKHIEVEPEDGSRVAKVSSMITSKILQKKLKEIRFSNTLNEICITRPKYGGVLVKNVNGVPRVVAWENVVVDPTDVLSAPIIEKNYYTPSEILEKDGWDNKEEAIKGAQEWRENDIKQEGNSTETQGYLIQVNETAGIVPKSMLLEAKEEDYDPEDDYKFVYAQIITVGDHWVDDEGEEKGLVLFAEELDEPIYKYLARNPITGRSLGEGVIENLFEHQKWHNFSKTEEMRMIAVAGKKVYVTDDPDVLSNIFDEGIDHGAVLRVSEGKTITELNQIPTGTPVYQNIRVEWDDSASRVTSSFNAKIGEEAKSGTPFRSQYLQNIEASSQFEQYREEIGEDLVKPIVEEWILPNAIKEYSSTDNIYATFTPQELQLIDETIIKQKTIEFFVQETLKRNIVRPEMMTDFEEKLSKELAKTNKRELTHIKEFIKNAPKHVVITTTDEARNKAVYFESLANALSLLAPEDPRRNAIVDKILEAIGIPKEELEIYLDNPIQSNPNPQLESKEISQTQTATLPVTP